MTSVLIECIPDASRTASPALQEMERTYREIEQRAFGLWQRRGATPGRDLDDWLRAEREVIWAPRSEMVERPNDYYLRIATPGLDPGDVHVTATPQSIVVRATQTHRHEDTGGSICFCEFRQRLFRRFDLPGRIDLNKVSAHLEKGMLEITAVKAKPTEPRNIAVTGQSQRTTQH